MHFDVTCLSRATVYHKEQEQENEELIRCSKLVGEKICLKF